MDFLTLFRSLRDQNINYCGPERNAVESQFRDEHSALIRQLRQEFGRLVVLDTNLGMTPEGAFDIELFLKVAWKKMATALGHYFDESTFHPEQITQLLKSEEPLLFCFLSVDRLSDRDMHRLRGLGFSQDSHRILYVGTNSWLDRSAYPIFAPATAISGRVKHDGFLAIAPGSECLTAGPIGEPPSAPTIAVPASVPSAETAVAHSADDCLTSPVTPDPSLKGAVEKAVVIIVNGSHSGQVVSLARERTVIGRHPSCRIMLDNAAVSRNHAQIIESHGTWYLEDLRSRNGTLLNGVKIPDRTELRDGDEIRVCEVVLRFHQGTRQDSDEWRAAAAMDPGRVSGREKGGGWTVCSMSLSESASSDSGAIDDSVPDSSSIISSLDVRNRAPRTAVRPEAKLRAVMEISQNLALALKTDEVLPRILESLFKIFPQAERGFVVLKDAASDTLQVRCSRSRRDEPGDAPRLDVMILREAINEARATLSADATLGSRSGLSNDETDRRSRSVICAPLAAQSGESLGAIQIETFDAATPFTEDDLELLTTAAAQAGLALINAQLHTSGLGQHDRDDHDFATQLQLGFVPNVPPRAEGYEFFDFYETAQRVGGDFLDYVPLPEGRIAISVGDVAGKGVPAALLMARCCSDARAQLLAKTSLAEAMFHLNENVMASGAGHRFVTMVLAVLDPRTHSLTLVNAGHLPPLLRRADGTVRQVGVEACELPLGIASAVQFRETKLQIGPGELLLLFSDGVTEAMNSAAELYGAPRVAQVLSEHRGTARSLIEELVSSIDGFCGAVSPRDDMCLVAVQRVAVECD